MALTYTEFQPTSQQDWLAKIDADLKGRTTSQQMYYEVEEGLSISPFQTDRPIGTTKPIIGGMTKSGMAFHSGDNTTLRENALSMLENGVQAISLVVDEHTDWEVLLSDIYLDMITLILKVEGNESKVQSDFAAYIDKHYSTKNTDIIIQAPSVWHGFKNIISTQKAEIAFISRLKNIKAALSERISNKNTGSLAIQISLKNDFLAQVSELRAIRILWSQLLSAQGMSHEPITVITDISSNDTNIDIHPLIAINYLLMSSYMGMSDICFGLPYDGEELSRLCLNVQNIFQEEAHLNKVMDPTAGSYFVENLTQKMLLKLQ